MTGAVLIVTRRDDLHADVVAGKLSGLGGRWFRLNMDAFPAEYVVTLEYDGAAWRGEIRHEPSDDRVALDEIGAVWMRKKAEFAFSAALGRQEEAFARAETEHVLFSVLQGLDCFWMNHPQATRGAIWKGEQLQRASRMGFEAPPTLIGNDPGGVRRFSQDFAHDLIFKPLSSSTLAADRVEARDRLVHVMPTTLASFAEDDDAADPVRIAPCAFQAHIRKSHELRVTVIGQAVFAARLDTQADARTRVDSRNMAAAIPYRATALAPETEERCRAFVQSYGLNFGALDIIVTPDGREVFLENNPVGQFLYIEELVPELAMTTHLALCLKEGAALAARP